MTAIELLDAMHQQPFQPFRLVMTDGVGFDIRHPDLLMVGLHSATVGIPAQPNGTLYERTMKVDLTHVIRIEPLEQPATATPDD